MRRHVLALSLAAAWILSGCFLRQGSSWDATRKTVVEPMNSAFHRGLPRSIKQRDLSAIMGLYASDRGTGLRWNAAEPVPGTFDEEVLRWHGPPGDESIRSRYIHAALSRGGGPVAARD